MSKKKKKKEGPFKREEAQKAIWNGQINKITGECVSWKLGTMTTLRIRKYETAW